MGGTFVKRWMDKVLCWALSVIGAGILFIIMLVWKHDGQINELDKSKGVVEEKLKVIDQTQTEMKSDLKDIKREIFRRSP